MRCYRSRFPIPDLVSPPAPAPAPPSRRRRRPISMATTIQDISETSFPTCKRDVTYYFVLFFFVGPVWGVVASSWAFVLYSFVNLKVLSYSSRSQVLFALAICEVLFSIYHSVLVRRISGPSPITNADHIELQKAFRRILQSGLGFIYEDSEDGGNEGADRSSSPAAAIVRLERYEERAVDFRNWMRTWFGKAPWSHICVDQVHRWLYWSTFNAAIPPQDKLPEEHRMFLEEATELLEKRVGCVIPKEPNPSVKALLLTIDPINVLSRPLVWYLFVKVLNAYVRTWYELNYSLTYGRFKGLEYLLYIPPGYNREMGPDPVVFFHGLGLGVFQYQKVISHILSELPHVPFLIPLQPQISQDIFHPRFLRPMLRHEKVACLTGLLDRLGWAGPSTKSTRGVTLISHSNGSYSHAWMLKSCPEYFTRSCFVDPVTFCSWEGDVCFNFVYRTCTTGVDLIIRYFVGTELGVVNLIQRNFDWLSNTLWIEEVPNPRDPRCTLFLLGGRDCIVDSDRVKKYLTSHGVKNGLWYNPEGRHGQSLLVGSQGVKSVIKWINSPNMKN